MSDGWTFGRASTLKSRADSGADVCLLPSEAPSTCGVATRTPGGQRSRGEVRYLLSQNQLMICSRNCEEKFYFLKVEGLFSSGWSRYGLRRRQFFARHPEPEFPESLLCRLHVFRVSGAKSAIVSVIGDMAGFTSAVVLVSSAVGSMNYRQSLVLRDRVEAWPMVLIEFGFRFLDVAGDTEELEK